MDNMIFLGILFGPIVMLSFLVTILVLPGWIKKAKQLKLTWKDMHKIGNVKKVAGSGGIAVMIGFFLSLMLYIAVKTFVFQDSTHLVEIFGLLTVLFFAGAIGFIDDIFGWQKEGLSKRARISLLIFTAVPLMVLNVGDVFFAGIDFGIFYPLLLIPIGIVGATTTFNFLAGYNGLESSQGILILTALAIVTFITGAWWLSLISSCMVAALIAFYFFNKYPAKVFPGDILTYPGGALIACIAILGNIEKIAIFFFIPYILEFILKARGKLKKQSFSKVNSDKSLDLKYGKIYGLEHLAVLLLKKIKPSNKAYEWEVPLVINVFQIIVIVLGFILFL
ncbi:glycosyl transferase family 4 [archaeon]|jgi:UDP-N-acetylglucosamine--dolichyl-phosphate N-acetylglucosaminephosphotransferase|nr:glycosyl transferase family 4 [archaeon]